MAGTIQPTPGVELTPSSVQSTLQNNYITDFDFLNQYLPETDKNEFEGYGNRTITGFLRNVGTAEIPFASDLIKWSEQGRLHTKYAACSITSYAVGNVTAVLTVTDATITACNFRVGQVVFLSHNASNTSDKAIITNVTGLTFTVAYYVAAGGTIPDTGNADITAFVYGSEFKKGTGGMVGSLTPEPNIFDVKPVIIKDRFEISGSDMAQIGWIEVSSENGANGFLWYIKAEAETRLRYEDQLEMMSVEHIEAQNGSAAEAYLSTNTGGGNAGSQGLFAAIEDRGNVWSGGNPSTMADFDTVIERLDGQGSIAENTLFINRQFSLDLDDMLATQNSYGVGGTSYGMFNNDSDIALNLGFTGFRRGSYDFYKSDWKYLNDATLRGGLNGGGVNGVLVPAGTTTVYDQVLGSNAKRPFLHVRYRMVNNENRKMKSWITGSAGGASNSDVDAMFVNYLSERALCTLGANNFFEFKN
jgi:hypothetical protein